MSRRQLGQGRFVVQTAAAANALCRDCPPFSGPNRTQLIYIAGISVILKLFFLLEPCCFTEALLFDWSLSFILEPYFYIGVLLLYWSLAV